MKKSNWKEAIGLMLFFMKIGCFTFGGGWSILAQLEQEYIDKRKVISKSELTEMIAIGKSLPGLMVTNVCVIFGYHLAGYAGAVLSAIGITIPAVLILTLVTFFYDRLKSNYWCAAILRGISCSVPAIIANAGVSLGKDAFAVRGGILIFLLALPLCLFTSINYLVLIIIGGICGIIWMEVHEHAASH